MALTRLGTNAITSVPSSAITALPAGIGGKVLQVSSIVSNSSLQTLATSTYTDLTSLSLSITPSSTSNKILLMSNINCEIQNNEGFGIRFLRDATNIFTTTQNYAAFIFGTGSEIYATLPVVYIDSPSTTSSITYKVQASSYGGSSIVFNISMASIFYAIEIAG